MTRENPAAEETVQRIAREQWAALGGTPDRPDAVVKPGPIFPGPFAVSQLGAAAFATAADAVAELRAAAGLGSARVAVDLGIVTAWLQLHVPSIPDGWERRSPWSDVSLDYETADGRWVRLQANYPHLRRAAAAGLDAAESPEAFAAAIRALDADTAERRLVDAGAAAAASRTIGEWADHPQGRAVAAEPLVDMVEGAASEDPWLPRTDRPLSGLKVLDITRVRAGPTATRFLAGLGAEVLRIDRALSKHWVSAPRRGPSRDRASSR
jgi:crotonobetainyl-CoA:carnitine CoA-transferase CaiB-like acyl-CoA transferase